MTDLLNEIDRRMKYLDRYLPQGRRVPVTNEERAQKIALEREGYERCIELLAIGKARMIAQQCSKP